MQMIFTHASIWRKKNIKTNRDTQNKRYTTVLNSQTQMKNWLHVCNWYKCIKYIYICAAFIIVIVVGFALLLLLLLLLMPPPPPLLLLLLLPQILPLPIVNFSCTLLNLWDVPFYTYLILFASQIHPKTHPKQFNSALHTPSNKQHEKLRTPNYAYVCDYFLCLSLKCINSLCACIFLYHFFTRHSFICIAWLMIFNSSHSVFLIRFSLSFPCTHSLRIPRCERARVCAFVCMAH